MHRVLFIFAVQGMLLLALPADAGDLNKRLKGDYAVATTSFCAQTQAGFGPEGQALGPVTLLSRVIETTRTYNGDGTLTLVGRTFQVNTPSGTFPTSESEFTCSGTYQVNEDDSFAETNTCSGNVLTGAAASQTFTQSPVTINGQIRGKTLLFKETRALPATVVTLSVAGDFFRLCATTGTGVKLPK